MERVLIIDSPGRWGHALVDGVQVATPLTSAAPSMGRHLLETMKRDPSTHKAPRIVFVPLAPCSPSALRIRVLERESDSEGVEKPGDALARLHRINHLLWMSPPLAH
jgi:hypothetical protein